MKKISDLQLGFSDAENYHRREHKELFNKFFLRDYSLDKLLEPTTYFLIGEKGTGKTAYAVYLANNLFKETKTLLKYIRETEYDKFVFLKQDKHLSLSDYVSIWKVIILVIIADSIDMSEINSHPFSKKNKIKAIKNAVDEYYHKAFSPEISNALNFAENAKVSAGLVSKHLQLGGEKETSFSSTESSFQINLMYLQRQLEKAISNLKLSLNHTLFIDGIDIRPGSIPYNTYIECIKGLANAVWSINNDFFSSIKDSKGRIKVCILLRPDIYNSLNLQNSINKIKDNSVYLDWRTTYPDYRQSNIFHLAGKMLACQQTDSSISPADAWDYYFPWKSNPTSPQRSNDPSFIQFLRLSYSRPRDIISAMQFLKQISDQEDNSNRTHFAESDVKSSSFENIFSEYMLGGVKDQLSFYYNEENYNTFILFFMFLEGYNEFTYDQFVNSFKLYSEHIQNSNYDTPGFLERHDTFLQFLFDANIICYIEDMDFEPMFRWCYRERALTNISPKVRLGVRYRIHYGLQKALNVGNQQMRKK